MCNYMAPGARLASVEVLLTFIKSHVGQTESPMDISSQLELANAKVTKLYVSEDPREKSSGWYLINFLGVKSTRNQAGVQDPMW